MCTTDEERYRLTQMHHWYLSFDQANVRKIREELYLPMPNLLQALLELYDLLCRVRLTPYEEDDQFAISE